MGGAPEDCRSHLTGVYYTRRPRDLFRKRFWVRCWCCNLRFGPYVHFHTALDLSRAYGGGLF